jgi:excisionase family DNA binding protein
MKLMKVHQVARLLDMTENRVYELCKTEVLPHIRFGRQIRLSEDQLQEFILNGGRALEKAE